MFSYNIAIERLDFLVDENILEFFDEMGELIRYVNLVTQLKVDKEFFIALDQSFFRKFDSLLYIKKSNYCEGKVGSLKVYANFFGSEEASYYRKIEDIAKRHDFKSYVVDKHFGSLITHVKVDCSILDLRYI